MHLRSLPPDMAQRIRDLDPITDLPLGSAGDALQERILATDRRTVGNTQAHGSAASPSHRRGTRWLLPITAGVAVFAVITGASVAFVARRAHHALQTSASATQNAFPKFGLGPASPQLTTRLVLSRTRVVTGSPITATVVVTNHGASSINLTHGCEPSYAVVLTDAGLSLPAGLGWPAICIDGPLIMRPGVNRLPATVLTTYLSCGQQRQGSTPACLGTGSMPALPPGRYAAVLVGNGDLRLPPPRPVAVVLTPSAASDPNAAAAPGIGCVGTIRISAPGRATQILSNRKPLDLTIRTGDSITVATSSRSCVFSVTGAGGTTGVLTGARTSHGYTAYGRRSGAGTLLIYHGGCQAVASVACRGGIVQDGTLNVTVTAQ